MPEVNAFMLNGDGDAESKKNGKYYLIYKNVCSAKLCYSRT